MANGVVTVLPNEYTHPRRWYYRLQETSKYDFELAANVAIFTP
jgi:hypothetical protein